MSIDLEERPGRLGPPAHRRRRRRRPRWVQWVVIPLAVFLVAEIVAQVGLRNYGPWYSQTGPVDFVFIGSSRVASAIDENAFAAVMSKQMGRPVRVLNLGRGESTAAEQAIGLRDLNSSMPAASRNYVLFIEAPGGLPDPLMQGTWKDAWVDQGDQGLIVRLLRGRDIVPLWRSHTGLGTKINLTFRWLTHRSSLITYREGWKDIILSKATNDTQDALAKLDPKLRSAASQPANLRSAGGVRRDPAGLELARQQAMALDSQDLSTEQPWRGWDQQILADIVRTHEANGGQVVFYGMPLSSYFQRSYTTPVRAQDRVVFTAAERSWSTPYLNVPFPTTDADFPDLWHLSATDAPRFSASLAQTWLASGCAARIAPLRWTASCPGPAPATAG